MTAPSTAIEAAAVLVASAAITFVVVAVRRARLIQLAQQVSARAHVRQVDHAGLPYVLHPNRVAARVKGNWRARIVALLHDVIEDSDITEADLRLLFPERIVDAVVAITHLPHERRVDYWSRVKNNPLALIVKLADIEDNSDPERIAALRAVSPDRADRLERKYAEALAFLSTPDVNAPL